MQSPPCSYAGTSSSRDWSSALLCDSLQQIWLDQHDLHVIYVSCVTTLREHRRELQEGGVVKFQRKRFFSRMYDWWSANGSWRPFVCCSCHHYLSQASGSQRGETAPDEFIGTIYAQGASPRMMLAACEGHPAELVESLYSSLSVMDMPIAI